MRVKELNDKSIDEIRGTFARTRNWHEGVDLIGFWPTAESFVFQKDDQYWCISEEFLEEVLLGDLARQVMHIKKKFKKEVNE